jgi:hypothetical protein
MRVQTHDQPTIREKVIGLLGDRCPFDLDLLGLATNLAGHLDREGVQAGLNPEQDSLTALYNERPTWLANAHADLDRAVLDAYGWSADISDEEMIARLLEMNLAREPA